MQRLETSVPGVYEFRPVVHRDSRGSLLETYHKARFSDLGINDNFVQDNHPFTPSPHAGILRGFHYQLLGARTRFGEPINLSIVSRK